MQVQVATGKKKGVRGCSGKCNWPPDAEREREREDGVVEREHIKSIFSTCLDGRQLVPNLAISAAAD